jgi:uncharacterized protein (TIGR02597 family)
LIHQNFVSFRKSIAMRPLTAIAAVFCLAGSVSAQTTVATNPVGFTTVTVTPGLRALSLPENKLPDFAAAVTTVNAAGPTIQTTGAGWTTNAFGPFTGNPANPHVIRMTTGTAVGKQYRIQSNTSDTLTLVTGTDLTGVAAGDQYQIFASETLQSLFGVNGQINGQSLNTNADPTQADNILLRSSTWITYFNDGTQWLRQGPGTLSNTVAVPPEQGFLFVRRGSTNYNFTALGAVPITNLKTDFPANAITSFGNRFPVDATLVGLGLDTLAGWNKNTDPTQADNVLVRGGTSWITYYYDATQGGPTNGNPGSWIRQGPQSINQNPAIPTGTSIVVVRRAGSTITLNQNLPYSLQ